MSSKLLLMLGIFLGLSVLGSDATTASASMTYPAARRDDLVETLHGVKVPDPYRWMENVDAPEVATWIAAENKLTDAYMAGIPQRDVIRKRLDALANYERFSVPEKAGHRYFFSKNDGLQNQSPIYYADSLNGTPKLLLDPNTLRADGTVALNSTSVSDDGKYFAYALSSGGSDWQEWRIRDVDTGKDLPDVLSWTKFTGASWSPDNKGFYYGRYEAPKEGALKEANYYQKLYYHKINTAQADDVLVYERPDEKEWAFSGDPTRDGHYLVIGVSQGTFAENRLFYKDLRHADSKVVELFSARDAEYSYVGNDGSTFYFLTTNAAPNRRIIAVDLNHPEPDKWKTVVPEGKFPISGVNLFGHELVVQALEDSHSVIRRYDLSGKQLGEISMPGIGTASGFGGHRTSDETFFSFTSFTTPSTIYRYAVKSNEVSIFKKPTMPFDSNAYTTEQVFFPSKDGTKIPMFLTYKKGLVKNGNNPTIITGYGGFNISTTPGFSSRTAAWLEMGGIYASVVLRGGGDYGKTWNEAGKLSKKQNVFDDFIAGAEWLIANKYTSTPKLGCTGGSNGGLLIGAVETQRPDLWGAAVPQVGVLDMLRFDKFTIGWAWKSDYGDPAVEADFKTLLAYSPYYNVKPGVSYPPTFITTGDHDDRVFPAHSFKFAAAMQHDQAGDAPVLISIEHLAGHGAGKPISKALDEAADVLAFFCKNLGV